MTFPMFVDRGTQALAKQYIYIYIYILFLNNLIIKEGQI